MDVYADGLHSCLNIFSRAATDVATPANAGQAATNVSLPPASEAQTGSGSQGNVWESFQCRGEPVSPVAGPGPYFFLGMHQHLVTNAGGRDLNCCPSLD